MGIKFVFPTCSFTEKAYFVVAVDHDSLELGLGRKWKRCYLIHGFRDLVKTTLKLSHLSVPK
jgi:hypothetical protein